MDKQKSIQVLQAYATGLATQSRAHKVQSQLFASQGLNKLAEKYAGHADEEMDLGGEAKVEASPAFPIYADPVEFIKADLKISVEQVPILMQVTSGLADDFKTYDLLREYALDEEEDMFWMQGELELIEKIGLQNWLTKQI